MFNLSIKAAVHWVMGLGLLWGAAAHAGPLALSADFQEVTDAGTGLIWRSCPEGQTSDTARVCTGAELTFTHEDALKRAKAQATATGLGWRVPNVKELSSIVDRTRSRPTLDTTVFPVNPSLNEARQYWTSTPEIGTPAGGRRAMTVSFAFGFTDVLARSDNNIILRLVRNAP
jgi:Protein of unknown function (DUF1566)